MLGIQLNNISRIVCTHHMSLVKKKDKWFLEIYFTYNLSNVALMYVALMLLYTLLFNRKLC